MALTSKLILRSWRSLKWQRSTCRLSDFQFKLNGQIEMETKIDLDQPGNLTALLLGAANLRLIEFEERREEHLIVDVSETAYYVVVLDALRHGVRLKLKENEAVFFTPNLRIPVLRRRSCKYTGEAGTKIAQSLVPIAAPYKYTKHCAFYYFESYGVLFSLGISLAENNGGFRDYQVEIEFEGALADLGVEGEQSVYVLLERLFVDYFPSLLVATHGMTKRSLLVRGTETGRGLGRQTWEVLIEDFQKRFSACSIGRNQKKETR